MFMLLDSIIPGSLESQEKGMGPYALPILAGQAQGTLVAELI